MCKHMIFANSLLKWLPATEKFILLVCKQNEEEEKQYGLCLCSEVKALYILWLGNVQGVCWNGLFCVKHIKLIFSHLVEMKNRKISTKRFSFTRHLLLQLRKLHRLWMQTTSYESLNICGLLFPVNHSDLTKVFFFLPIIRSGHI